MRTHSDLPWLVQLWLQGGGEAFLEANFKERTKQSTAHNCNPGGDCPEASMTGRVISLAFFPTKSGSLGFFCGGHSKRKGIILGLF